MNNYKEKKEFALRLKTYFLIKQFVFKQNLTHRRESLELFSPNSTGNC